jgi:hypothetical protein
MFSVSDAAVQKVKKINTFEILCVFARNTAYCI